MIVDAIAITIIGILLGLALILGFAFAMVPIMSVAVTIVDCAKLGPIGRLLGAWDRWETYWLAKEEKWRRRCK